MGPAQGWGDTAFVEGAGGALPFSGRVDHRDRAGGDGWSGAPTLCALVVTQHHELNAPSIIGVEHIVTINLMS